ncbi:putative DNA-binding domain-containing protein [Colwellia psychrerythraea]|uniref:Putative DNA-binding domain-containing protein n=1 Tax=Colwellia psychrerythraea TaxID=28229 RepID=A0A099KMS4_COLPS|nr:putative DNA-binding domain-containing protein [Colwellia psychrerythraea]KGJ91212.1 Protein of unknown function DUF2063 [Colwellia psychrerythraea]
MNELSKTETGKNESTINESVKNEQRLLLEVIWNDEPLALAQCGFNAQGINIYRRNLLVNAQRALTISFPTVFALLDSDISESLVYQFLRVSAPNRGDWTQWGEHFSHFLSTTEVGADYPYLADCAALDWYVHCALHGRDQTLASSTLQLLSKGEPEQLFIAFNQNVKVFKTAYPLTEIFQAHHNSDELQRKVAMGDAQKVLASVSVEQVVMVYRPEFQPQVTTLSASEGAFMLSLLSGQSLAQSLDAVKYDNEFSFEQWLFTAIERNLINIIKEKKI